MKSMAIKYMHDMLLDMIGKRVRSKQANTGWYIYIYIYIYTVQNFPAGRQYEVKDKFQCLHCTVLQSPVERSYIDGQCN